MGQDPAMKEFNRLLDEFDGQRKRWRAEALRQKTRADGACEWARRAYVMLCEIASGTMSGRDRLRDVVRSFPADLVAPIEDLGHP